MKRKSRSPSPQCSKDKRKKTAWAPRRRRLRPSTKTFVRGHMSPPTSLDSFKGTPLGTSQAASPPSASALEERRESNRLPDPTTRRYTAYILTTLVISVLAALVLYMSVAHYLSETKKDTCYKPGCREYAQLLTLSMNKSVSPCGNFYHRVCDGWIRINKNTEKNFVGVRRREEFIKGVWSAAAEVMKKSPATGQTGIQNGASFYMSCATVLTADDKNHVSTLKEILMNAHNTWPHFPEKEWLIESMLYIITVLDVPVALDANVAKNGTHATVSLGQPTIFHYMKIVKTDVTRRGSYEKYIQMLKEHFSTSGKPTITYNEQLNLDETLLGSLTRAVLFGKSDAVSEMTVDQFAEHTPGATAHRWRAAIRDQLLVPSILRPMVKTDRLPFLEAFFNLSTHVGESKMQMFLGFLTVQNLAMFVNHDIATIMYEHEEQKEQHGWRCFDLVNKYMGKAVVVPYIAKQMEQPTRSDILDIATTVEKTYQRIHGTIQSVNLSYTVFKYVDSFLLSDLDKTFADFSDMGDNFIMNWKSAVASFRRRRAESVSFPNISHDGAVIYGTGNIRLHPYAFGIPTYDSDAPLAIKYAGLGAELSLAVNEVAKRFAHNDDDHDATCLKAVSSEATNGVSASYLSDQALAVETAWASFNLAKSKRETVESGIHDLSEDELFFVSWCYSLCSKAPQAEMQCNVPLKHSHDFTRVFGCDPRDPMNAERKCYRL